MKECDRLVTTNKRKHRSHIKEERISKVRSLHLEADKVYSKIRNLGYTKLKKPLRDGWYRIMVLRSDIAKHKKALVYQEILDLIGEKFWGREKKYADRACKEKYDQDRYLYLRPDLRYIRKRVYLKLSTAARKHFTLARIKINYRYRRRYVCTLPRYFFVVTYEHAYISYRKIIAPELESRYDEIRNELMMAKYHNLSYYNTYHFKFYHNPNRKRRRRTNIALRAFDIDYLDALNDSNKWGR